MLSNWQSLECAVEGSSSLSHEGLLKQERKVDFPYPRHLVKKDKRSLEQRIHLLVFTPVLGRIAAAEVVHPKFKVLYRSVDLGPQFRMTKKKREKRTIFHSL